MLLALVCSLMVTETGVIVPDPKCTPGAVLNVTQEQVLAKGFGKKSRDVDDAKHAQVYEEYGIKSYRAGEYEIDHLYPVCGGGASTLANLYPQPASPQPGFHQKDLVETYACKEMRKGHMTLAEVQAFVEDWTAHLARKGKKWKVTP